MDDKSYKEYLEHITTFIFDVDGVLTDGTVTIMTNGDMLRRMNIKDGYALKTAKDAGFNICIISGGSNLGVQKRLEGLGITDIYLGAHNKIEQYNDYLETNDISADQVLYMGDDIPDIPVMKLVGLATCPQDAVPEVKAVSKYISHRHGGKGAVRDIIEQVMKVQDKWDGNFDAKYD
ncbi:HAD-IIIA family hydrolase [Psychroserpens sp.]|uniref:KdsC family phosphatase n=1 Tax=Psychroserpens sp. TaxID=2020870 RepID=UPI001B0B2FA3|nr:HAD-IIIA family hydrolase [Psychroserpens sp.]MBO6607532.1 HAD-IIIA family hydrolase [Psychroserpens sp.]MBO6655192.1 HAD-IIIA family hydrolase [Psychroserpens sp.]MBO6683218.1 HAD-IIIA family hydrolase [Psychroserpens sp.]MBO6749782.1 HAD-IIIA family hydrolase [Psychroserpens sp.]MBO6916706.1 HAD-IIIA family hydrolase [Psychroserpens sp.]